MCRFLVHFSERREKARVLLSRRVFAITGLDQILCWVVARKNIHSRVYWKNMHSNLTLIFMLSCPLWNSDCIVRDISCHLVNICHLLFMLTHLKQYKLKVHISCHCNMFADCFPSIVFVRCVWHPLDPPCYIELTRHDLQIDLTENAVCQCDWSMVCVLNHEHIILSHAIGMTFLFSKHFMWRAKYCKIMLIVFNVLKCCYILVVA